MKIRQHWRELGYEHTMWELLRYYRSISAKREQWLVDQLKNGSEIGTKEDLQLLAKYIQESPVDQLDALSRMRTETAALEFCSKMEAVTRTTATKSLDHHQSSNALVVGIVSVVQKVCCPRNIPFDPAPQRRAFWLVGNKLHVTARNLDGAVPSLNNPKLIWESKEYWGKTKGGSKMSDAVYECHLVGMELRNFEKRSKIKVEHIVFLDGKEQWGHRKSDVTRFVDLFNQGLIDYLFCGSDVETEWEGVLQKILD